MNIIIYRGRSKTRGGAVPYHTDSLNNHPRQVCEVSLLIVCSDS
jgi:hypothetical protein